MTKTIGLHFPEFNAIKYVKTDKDFPLGTWLLVNDAKGSRLAQVKHGMKQLQQAQLPGDMPYVIGKASDMDMKAYRANLAYAEASKADVKALIKQNQLSMKVIDIIFPLDRSYVLITFSAEERVDFRQLLKDLAALFKTRIELRQLNNREEAKVYGGIGPCGRPICCSTFLGEFPAVSIKMLKNQDLSLNSGKSLGYCGRFLCCLQYEDAFYSDRKKRFPDYGTLVETKEGKGRVISVNIFEETVKVAFEDKQSCMTYILEEIKIGQ
ncbi:signal peptidase II [Streptococcus uberis]|nr:regulatory iron-sulfur-containing complex subunit RicT [Streptococcus uberis]MCK1197422.1 signal peptidase II [Streptococcus uberis]